MGRLVDADKYMKRLQSEVNSEADIIAKYIKEDIPIGTVKDCGRIGRLQGVQWCKNVLELDYYTVEAIPKANYEARLKADLEAILVKLQLEIEELCIDNPMAEFERDMNIGIEKAADVIQQKIDKLKGANNE